MLASAGRCLWLPVAGFATALFATMAGGGGGFLFVPLLVLLYSLTPQQAATTSLAVTVPIALLGGIEHFRRGHIDFRAGGVFGAAGVAGAFTGALVSEMASPALMRRIFGIYAAVLALIMLATGRKRGEASAVAGETARNFGAAKITAGSFFGLVSGAIAGLFGTSGAAPVLAGLYIMKLPVRVIVGTSGMVVFLNSLSGLSGHLLSGKMDWKLALLLGGGAVPGALAGPRLLARIQPATLEIVYRYVLSAMVMAAGAVMILT